MSSRALDYFHRIHHAIEKAAKAKEQPETPPKRNTDTNESNKNN